MAPNLFGGAGFQPAYQYPWQTQTTAMPNSQPSSSIMYVDGINVAKMYPLAPGTEGAFFDSGKEDILYRKSTDANGRPSQLRIFRLVEIDESEIDASLAPKIDLSKYITRDEIRELIASSTQAAVDKAISEISLKPTSSKKKKEGDE